MRLQYMLCLAKFLLILNGDVQDPDLVVEPMITNSNSQSARSSTSSSSASERRPPGNSGSTTRAAGASTPSSNPLRWDRQTIQFSVNAWVLVVVVLVMFPLTLKAFLIGHTDSPLWGLHALHCIHSILFMGNQGHGICRKCKFGFIALLPILCRSLEHSAKFTRRNFGRSSLYRKDRCYSEKDAAIIVRQMLKFAAECHLHGLVDRDMKPEA
ncbi:hypothetical protein R6Q57_004651 [Mikania cordata]